MPDLDPTNDTDPSVAEEPRQRLAPGTILGGRYQLGKAVAAGGFGAVYEARHLRGDRRVAVKVLHAWLADDPKTKERFRRELQAPAQIAHPGIVEVLDADVDPSGVPFLVMNWLEGETLRERLDQGRLSLTELRDVFDPFLDALDAAHSAGFIHRDLKPENCMLIRNADGVERPRIVDFGLARKTGANSVTVTGTSLGTPRYMSPEQFMNAKVVGPESDVWAVGSMMYEALVGETPFVAERPHALMLQILTVEHTPLKTHLPHLPPRLAKLIEECLDKEPGKRPRDAHALRSRFLGAFAAISGGLALRTIPEMPKTDASALMSAPALVGAPAAQAVTNREVRPRAKVPSAARARSRPPATRPSSPRASRPSKPSTLPRALFWSAGLGIGFLLLAGLAFAIFFGLGHLTDRTAPPPPRAAPARPIAPPGVGPVLRPVTPPHDAPPHDAPPPTETSEGSPDPLRPLTSPLDRLLFE